MASKPGEVKDEPTDRNSLADPSGGPQVEGTGDGDGNDDGNGDADGDGDGDGTGDGGTEPKAAALKGEKPKADPKGKQPKQPPAPAPAVTLPDFVAEATGNRSEEARDLLLDACERYGINPVQDQRPVELSAWKYRPANAVEQVPASVTLVTAGGLKIVHYEDDAYPADPETEERLRNVFGAWRKDKDGTRVALPLPTDMTLPQGAVTGLAMTDDHVYRRGYLREGGKTEAQRRGRR